ncbi:hypothetical protein VHEMI03912 [[Torrubiella] hemipterigena]|uniref:SGNH hydrolase-type esterase domain-containing protein n=1 Tax=[Torrubiella] hemipterigena TaxID=1531966 RepID=A0A0A1TCM9_9HYPO|nr:hypothetical protein VHEMI03912 [[Torrubiella] hemipterigena]
MGRPVLRILCFGDSLTSGYFRWGCGSKPYSEVLSSRLQAEFPDLEVKVTTDGVPGDVASHPRFYDRFRRQFSSQFTYDWVIVLCGTNDIAIRASDNSIYSGLRATWDYALSKRSKVLALTIPETSFSADWVTMARDDVNTRILDHKAPQYYAFDLKSHIPYANLTEDERSLYWDDGVHLTDDGYDWMGGHIADHLIPLIAANPPVEETPVKPTARRQRRTRSNDEVVWEEEEGNPKQINQGYVIVRRRDLD